jgi:hypothetical protein
MRFIHRSNRKGEAKIDAAIVHANRGAARRHDRPGFRIETSFFTLKASVTPTKQSPERAAAHGVPPSIDTFR